MEELHETPGEEWQNEAMEAILAVVRPDAAEAELRNQEVCFLWENIADHQQWRAVGEIQFLPYLASRQDESILQICLTIAQEVEENQREELDHRLMELNNTALLGQFGQDQMGHLYYLARIPLVTTEASAIASVTELTLFEMLEFLDQFYAYVLLLLTEPNKLTLDEYLKLIAQDLPEER